MFVIYEDNPVSAALILWSSSKFMLILLLCFPIFFLLVEIPDLILSTFKCLLMSSTSVPFPDISGEKKRQKNC